MFIYRVFPTGKDGGCPLSICSFPPHWKNPSPSRLPHTKFLSFSHFPPSKVNSPLLPKLNNNFHIITQ